MTKKRTNKKDIKINIAIPQIDIEDFIEGIEYDQDVAFEIITRLEKKMEDAEFLEKCYLHFKKEHEEQLKVEHEWEEKQKKNK